MTPESARARARKLLALAATESGAAPEEARSAAHAAAKLIIEHHLLDGGQASPIDLDQVTELALKAMELEHALAEARAALTSERAAHTAAIRERDQEWRQLVDRVRKEERGNAHVERTRGERKAVRADREALARSGGHERARRLTHEEKSEIGRKGAAERWARWRERRGSL